MINILITGGAGRIGINLLSKLVLDNNYNITVLDLKTASSVKKLRKFSDRIEIVYGDINNQTLMRKLIRKNDVIFHFASVTPPLANEYRELCEYINLLGTEHICDLINSINPDCHLIYLSSIFDSKKSDYVDNYTVINKKIEEYIKKKINRYTIINLQPVLIPQKNIWINTELNTPIQFINLASVNNLLFEVLNHLNKNKNKTINGYGSNKFITTYFNHISSLKLINKFKYHRLNNELGYRTTVFDKDELYHQGSIKEYYKECGYRDRNSV